MAASKEGIVTGSDFTPQANLHTHSLLLSRKHLLEVLSLSSTNCGTGAGRDKILREAKKVARCVWSTSSGKLPHRKATSGLGCSLYLKVLLAALLQSLYEIDNGQFRGELQILAWIPPPFGSWSTSSPASEDD